MLPQKQVEEAIVSRTNSTLKDELEHDVDGKGEDEDAAHGFSMKSLLWHDGFAWDAWFSCASNQLGMLSGIILQLFYGFMGSWTVYLISVLYIEYRTRKEKENVSFKNHVIQWFEVLDGLLGPYWKVAGLAFNCAFLLFGSVI